jgi:hypothetical protein
MKRLHSMTIAPFFLSETDDTVAISKMIVIAFLEIKTTYGNSLATKSSINSCWWWGFFFKDLYQKNLSNM